VSAVGRLSWLLPFRREQPCVIRDAVSASRAVRIMSSRLKVLSLGGAKVGRAKRRSIQCVEHLTGDGATIFHHVCRMGLEGIVSKRTDAPYRSGPSRTWLKSKNPASEAVRREREEEWR
jgi:hypothetical protein